MFITINFSEFCDRFQAMDRAEQFSYEAKRKLFDYLEDFEESTGELIELDVISLCCEWSEEKINDVLENYNLDSVEELEDHTSVITIDDETVLYAQF